MNAIGNYPQYMATIRTPPAEPITTKPHVNQFVQSEATPHKTQNQTQHQLLEESSMTDTAGNYPQYVTTNRTPPAEPIINNPYVNHDPFLLLVRNMIQDQLRQAMAQSNYPVHLYQHHPQLVQV